MAKAGRPAYEVTEDVIKKVESLASQGLTLEQIARVLGITYKTLNEKNKQFSELSDAIKSGQAKGIATISNALFNNAKNGNITAQIFYLKNRAPEEWKDRVPEGAESDRPTPQTVRVEIVSAKADTTAG